MMIYNTIYTGTEINHRKVWPERLAASKTMSLKNKGFRRKEIPYSNGCPAI